MIEVWAIPHFGNGFKYSRRSGVKQTSENAVRLQFISQDRQAKLPSICNVVVLYLLTELLESSSWRHLAFALVRKRRFTLSWSKHITMR